MVNVWSLHITSLRNCTGIAEHPLYAREIRCRGRSFGSERSRESMPTYEYICKACGNVWEAQQRISEDPLKECPKCHAPQAVRQISGGNFILKGGGWYSDLYSSPAPKKTEKSESTTSEPKSESKPAEATKTPSTPPKKAQD